MSIELEIQMSSPSKPERQQLSVHSRDDHEVAQVQPIVSQYVQLSLWIFTFSLFHIHIYSHILTTTLLENKWTTWSRNINSRKPNIVVK